MAHNGQTRAPHVVMVPVAATGHHIPMMEFAKQLATYGVTISFLSTDQHITELEASYGTRDFRDQGLDLRLVTLNDGMAPQMGSKDFMFIMRDVEMEEKMKGWLEKALVSMREKASNEDKAVPGPPSCILVDMFLGWSQDVADKLNIPRHVIYASPAGGVALKSQMRRILAEKRLPITPENQSEMITYLPGLPPTSPTDLPTFIHYESGPFYHFALRHHVRLIDAEAILVNTFHEYEEVIFNALETEVVKSPNYKLVTAMHDGFMDLCNVVDIRKVKKIMAVGPLLPKSVFNVLNPEVNPTLQGEEQKDPCLQFLHMQSPNSVLFISYGSYATISEPQVLELAKGLEAARQSFLWILRPSHAPHGTQLHDPAAVSALLPSGFEERTKGWGFVYPGWAPQLQILGHPSTGGFLTHCGWNSVLESICAGIPMLGWPMAAEQKMNCRYLVDITKLAVEFQKGPDDLVASDEVEKVVRYLMEEEGGRQMRSRVLEMKDMAGKAVSSGGSSQKNMESYADELKHALFLGTKPYHLADAQTDGVHHIQPVLV